MQLSRAPVQSTLLSQRIASAQRVTKVVVRANGDDRSKIVREYREDSDEVVVPGQEKKADNALYVDQIPAAARPKDNMSREMKQRLRQEYYGLGGAENQVSRPSRSLMVVAAGSVLTDEPETITTTAASTTLPDDLSAAVAAAERALNATPSSSSTTTNTRPKTGSSKWIIDPNENLKSTMEHRLWTYGCMGLLSASLISAAADVHSAADGGTAVGAMFAAYVLADFGTAVYHWAVDNYGDGSTPVFGSQIAAFQGHHQRPWTITQREFCNNVHLVFKPAAFPAAGILAISPWLPLSWHTFLPSFLFLVCMSQQFHAWSHMKKSELHPAVVALQDANILIGRKDHGAHHKPNFEGNYSIVSGWVNPLLDNTGFFRWLEKVVHQQTGVEPRCWYPPDHEWAEQVQPGQ